MLAESIKLPTGACARYSSAGTDISPFRNLTKSSRMSSASTFIHTLLSSCMYIVIMYVYAKFCSLSGVAIVIFNLSNTNLQINSTLSAGKLQQEPIASLVASYPTTAVAINVSGRSKIFIRCIAAAMIPFYFVTHAVARRR